MILKTFSRQMFVHWRFYCNCFNIPCRRILASSLVIVSREGNVKGLKLKTIVQPLAY